MNLGSQVGAQPTEMFVTKSSGVSSGVHQWKGGDNGETKQLEERKKGRISIMASDGR